jgi:hypothetical protein
MMIQFDIMMTAKGSIVPNIRMPMSRNSSNHAAFGTYRTRFPFGVSGTLNVKNICKLQTIMTTKVTVTTLIALDAVQIVAAFIG